MIVLFLEIGSTGGQDWGLEGDGICLNHAELEKPMEYFGELMTSTQA